MIQKYEINSAAKLSSASFDIFNFQEVHQVASMMSESRMVATHHVMQGTVKGMHFRS